MIFINDCSSAIIWITPPRWDMLDSLDCKSTAQYFVGFFSIHIQTTQTKGNTPPPSYALHLEGFRNWTICGDTNIFWMCFVLRPHINETVLIGSQFVFIYVIFHILFETPFNKVAIYKKQDFYRCFASEFVSL